MRIRTDSPVFRALTRVFDAVLIAVLWVLCTLPVVTAGTAASAMYASMLAIAGGDDGRVSARFFRSFRENFKVSTLVWLICLALGAVLGVDVTVCWFRQTPGGLLWQVLRGLTLCGAAVYLAVLPYLFAVPAQFVVTVRQTFRNALVLAVRNAGMTPCLMLLTAGMALSCALLWFYALPLLALGTYLQARILRRAFAPFVPEDEPTTEE